MVSFFDGVQEAAFSKSVGTISFNVGCGICKSLDLGSDDSSEGNECQC